MKKYLPLVIFSLLLQQAAAQYYIPFTYIDNIPTPNYYVPKALCPGDSLLFISRYGGLQTWGIATQQVKYDWKNFYSGENLQKTASGRILYVKNGSEIDQYNSTTGIDSTIYIPQQDYINDFGSSASKTWVLTRDSLVVLGGSSQQAYGSPSYYNSLQKILVKNDDTAYIENEGTIYLFSNGKWDSLINRNYNIVISWDMDTGGNVWVCDPQAFFTISPAGIVTILDTLPPLSYYKPGVVCTSNNGSVWALGNYNNILSKNDTGWKVTNISQGNIENISADKNTNRLYGITNTSVFIMDGDSVRYYPLEYKPYQGVTALSSEYIATRDGVFEWTYGSGYNYYDNVLAPYSYTPLQVITGYTPDTVQCFTTNSNGNYYGSPNSGYPFGSQHGCFLSGSIDNTQLPDSVVNCIYNTGGSYYIGTNKGLCVFNGVFYETFNTSNSPLPSNKITALASAQQYINSLSETLLYVGTDKGLAVYKSTGWTIYDSSTFNTNSLYITGIDAQPFYGSSAWVSTLGSGALQVYPDSAVIYNSTNSGLIDDTLYYAATAQLGDCGGGVLFGTSHHGVALADYDNEFYFDTIAYTYNAVPFYQSRLYTYTPTGGIILSADNGFLWAEPCGAVQNTPATPAAALRCYRTGNSIMALLPDGFNGKADLYLYDISGREISLATQNIISGSPVAVYSGNIPAGMYIVSARFKGETLQGKVVAY